jgi:hypothetical protein
VKTRQDNAFDASELVYDGVGTLLMKRRRPIMAAVVERMPESAVTS